MNNYSFPINGWLANTNSGEYRRGYQAGLRKALEMMPTGGAGSSDFTAGQNYARDVWRARIQRLLEKKPE